MKPGAEAGSRERMLEAAIDLMRGSGLSGAGINEVVRASGAPKGSVYHFFPAGKQQLAGEALTSYAQRVREFMDRALSGKRAPAEKIRALFNAFAQRVEEGGFRRSCAVGAVTLDLEPGMDALREVLAAAVGDWVALIAGHLAFADRRRAASFAGLVLTAIEGAYIRARAERSSRPFKEAGAWLAELARQQA